MGIGKSRRPLRTWMRGATAWRRRAVGGGLAVALGAGVLTAGPAYAAVAPDPPTNVVATPGDASATVSWTPPAFDGGSPITSYKIAVQPGTQFGSASGTETSGVVSNLTNGVTYTFTVRATNAEGLTSVASVKSDPIVVGGGTAATVPDAPTNVSAIGGEQGATVSWDPPANDGGSAITSYRVNVQPGSQDFRVVNAPTTSMFYDGLVNGVSYTFTVKAINIVGGSVSSAPSNSVIPGGGVAATVPDAPTGVTATAGANAATVQWTPPANNGGAAIQTYRVNIKPGTSYRLVTAPATSVLFDGLPGGQSVTFTVKAINAVGQSVASAPSNAVVPTGSATPPTKGGVWGVNSSGDLYRYANDGAGHLVYPPVRIGGGWAGYVLLSPEDFTGDGNADLVARKSNGDLMLYRGNGTGGLLYPPARLGGGWNVMNALFTPGDFTSDGRPDILARTTSGDLMLYRGNGVGNLVYPPTRIGGGWGGMNAFVAPGDFTGDGRVDLLARKTNGDLMLYRGTGAGNLVYPPARIGGGWGGMNGFAAPGDITGDGRVDLLARQTNGDLMLYRGTGAGNLVYPPSRIGGGWNVYKVLVGAR